MCWSILLFFYFFIFAFGVHFKGGTITWAPIDPYDNRTSINITITQSYLWTLTHVQCSNNVPTGTSSSSSANLICVADCLTDGGYSTAPINILTKCTWTSSSLDMMKSEASKQTTLSAGAHFYLAYKGGDWASLHDPPKPGLPWTILTYIDLRKRSDGLINTPPVAKFVSPQYAIVNRTVQINIPVSDVNAGDVVRCRWSTNTSTDECGGICYPNTVPYSTTLSNCTITFTGHKAGVLYAVAMQVEDFLNSTSNTPMSSVPVQMLIYVQPEPNCLIKPIISPLDRCLEVQVGDLISFNIFIMNLCTPTVTQIADFVVSGDVTGMSRSNLTTSPTNLSLSYVSFTWTPHINQIGSNQLCVLAFTSENLQSDTYCATFIVSNSSNRCLTTISTTITSTTTRTTTTSTTTRTTTTSTTTRTTTTSTTTRTTTTSTTTRTTTTSTTTRTTTTSTTTRTTTTSTTTKTTTTSTTTKTTTTSTTTRTTTTSTTTKTTTTSTTITTTTISMTTTTTSSTITSTTTSIVTTAFTSSTTSTSIISNV
ncbi:unnamed protein product [Rotaria magnacalcarata]